MHDASKVLLGSTQSSAKVITTHDGDPATYLAGLVLSLKSDSTLSLLLSDGKRMGVSIGASLSDHKKTAIVRKGLRVPVLFNNLAHGIVTVTSYANLIDDTDDTLTIGATVFTFQAGSATPGAATIQAATSNTQTATNIAAQINAHATASTVVTATSEGAVVFLRAKVAGATPALVYTDVDGTGTSVGATVSGANLTAAGSTVAKGTKVYVHDTTGYAVDSDDVSGTVTNAVYAESTIFTAVKEDGTTTYSVLVNMLGGI